MNIPSRLSAAIALALSAGLAAAQGQAMSDDLAHQFLAGAGMGYAKPAELNGYPGPMHVLELADKLELSAEQREQTRRLMESHKADARALGAKRVDAERRLEALFRSGKDLQSRELAEAVKTAGALDAEYRLSHLETHRRMRALLTDEQVSRYSALRGYGAEQHNQHKH